MRIDQPLATDTMVGIPLLPLNALSGGDGHNLYNVPAIGEADYMTTVAGASMSPTLLSGDIIACRRMPSDGIIQWGKIYIVDVGQGQPLIRRIHPGSSSDAVQLVSDNPSYDPIDLPRSGIVSLALVIGFIRVD